MTDDTLELEIASNHRSLKSYLMRRGLQSHDAEDLCQETYLRVLESLRDSPPRCIKALIFHIARNLLIDLRRSARHRWLRLTGDLRQLDRVTYLDPERHAIALEVLEQVIATVDDLPPRRREAFVLRRVEDISLKAIAGTMKIGVPAVEQQITLALRALRTAGVMTGD